MKTRTHPNYFAPGTRVKDKYAVHGEKTVKECYWQNYDGGSTSDYTVTFIEGGWNKGGNLIKIPAQTEQRDTAKTKISLHTGQEIPAWSARENIPMKIYGRKPGTVIETEQRDTPKRGIDYNVYPPSATSDRKGWAVTIGGEYVKVAPFATRSDAESYAQTEVLKKRKAADQRDTEAPQITGATFEGQEIPFNLHKPIRELLEDRDYWKVQAHNARSQRDELLAAAQRTIAEWPGDEGAFPYLDAVVKRCNVTNATSQREATL